jgi:hypothetical protein
MIDVFQPGIRSQVDAVVFELGSWEAWQCENKRALAQEG